MVKFWSGSGPEKPVYSLVKESLSVHIHCENQCACRQDDLGLICLKDWKKKSIHTVGFDDSGVVLGNWKIPFEIVAWGINEAAIQVKMKTQNVCFPAPPDVPANSSGHSSECALARPVWEWSRKPGGQGQPGLPPEPCVACPAREPQARAPGVLSTSSGSARSPLLFSPRAQLC